MIYWCLWLDRLRKDGQISHKFSFNHNFNKEILAFWHYFYEIYDDRIKPWFRLHRLRPPQCRACDIYQNIYHYIKSEQGEGGDQNWPKMSERTFWMVPWAKSSRKIFILSKIQNVYFTDLLEASLMLDDEKPLTNTRSNERTWVNLQNQPPESVGPNVLQEICYRPTNEPLKRSATSFQSRQGTKRVNIYMIHIWTDRCLKE